MKCKPVDAEIFVGGQPYRECVQASADLVIEADDISKGYLRSDRLIKPESGHVAHSLIVTQNDSGRFEAVVPNALDSPTIGRGSSVLEAVGEWAIQSRAVAIQCSPPALLREHRIVSDYQDLRFSDEEARRR